MLTTSKIITQLGKKKNILIPNKNGDFKVADGIKSKDELLRLTLRQLRQEASKLSVPLYSRKTKAVLVDLIVSYQKKIIQRPKAGTKELEVSQGQISTPESSLSSEVKTNLAN